MFDKILQDVYTLFASDAWKALNIQTYPADYQGKTNPGDIIKWNLLVGKGTNENHSQVKKMNGLLIMSIYMAAGNGPTKHFTLASQIAQLIDNKMFPNRTSFEVGSLTNVGLDPANKSLYRIDYSNNFSIYGE